MFHAKQSYKYYIRPKEVKIPTKWELIRSVGRKAQSDKAQLKLKWIIFYHTRGKGSATDTAKHLE